MLKIGWHFIKDVLIPYSSGQHSKGKSENAVVLFMGLNTLFIRSAFKVLKIGWHFIKDVLIPYSSGQHSKEFKSHLTAQIQS